MFTNVIPALAGSRVIYLSCDNMIYNLANVNTGYNTSVDIKHFLLDNFEMFMLKIVC